MTSQPTQESGEAGLPATHAGDKPRRMLPSDVRPLERCCGHHLLAHDSLGCLITGCGCQGHAGIDRIRRARRFAAR